MATKREPIPFEQVEDSREVKADPINSRVLNLFDALRKRGCSPDKAAYVCATVHASSGGMAMAPLFRGGAS